MGFAGVVLLEAARDGLTWPVHVFMSVYLYIPSTRGIYQRLCLCLSLCICHFLSLHLPILSTGCLYVSIYLLYLQICISFCRYIYLHILSVYVCPCLSTMYIGLNMFVYVYLHEYESVDGEGGRVG